MVEADPETPLLYILRNDLRLNGPKFGCGQGQCGACMVIMDRRVGTTCRIPVRLAEGRQITTLAGLKDREDNLHPVQQAFLDQQAAQCGYCTNGMIVSAIALLNQSPNPTDAEIHQFMQPVLCRCGSHARVRRAITQAVGEINTKENS